jgi:hypothetical protein
MHLIARGRKVAVLPQVLTRPLRDDLITVPMADLPPVGLLLALARPQHVPAGRGPSPCRRGRHTPKRGRIVHDHLNRSGGQFDIAGRDTARRRNRPASRRSDTTSTSGTCLPGHFHDCPLIRTEWL